MILAALLTQALTARSPEELAGVFAEHAAGAPTPAEGAEALAAWANAQGGRDNVTVVLIRITR